MVIRGEEEPSKDQGPFDIEPGSSEAQREILNREFLNATISHPENNSPAPHTDEVNSLEPDDSRRSQTMQSSA